MAAPAASASSTSSAMTQLPHALAAPPGAGQDRDPIDPRRAVPVARHRPRPRLRRNHTAPLARGLLGLYLSVFVLIPVAALLARSAGQGPAGIWTSVTSPEARSAIELTLAISLAVAVVNVVFGTLIAWVLVRDEFRGRRLVDALMDLPFALPTVVAGLTLLALYGPRGPLGIDVAFTRTAVLLALLFVTLPFVVRSVQPVLLELDRSMEEAAASLGASGLTIFRRIILASLMPAILSGAALSFARAIGEFGSVVLISGNLPNKTEVASVYVFGQIESDNIAGAASVSTVLLLLTLAIVGATSFLSARRGRHER